MMRQFSKLNIFIVFTATFGFLIGIYWFKLPRSAEYSFLEKTTEPTKTQLIVNTAKRNHYFTKPSNLQGLCNKSNVTLRTKLTDYMLIDETHKLLYCFVPKVGCTTWKKIFAVLSNEKIRNETKGNPENIRVDPHFGLRFRSIKTYNMSQQENILKTYYKFMFVREPFERLVSAYIDKFYVPEPHGFWRVWGRGIINRFRQNATATSRECGHDVRFEEFLSHSISSIERSYIQGGHGHWTTIHQLCNPCDVNYDYIGHMENMQYDTDVILKQANVSHLIHRTQTTSVNKIRENLHFSTRALIRSRNCLDTIEAVKRSINSLIFKGFLPTNFNISEYTRSLLLSSGNITDTKTKTVHIIKKFNNKLDEILSSVWETKLKTKTSVTEFKKEHCLVRLQKANIVEQIDTEKLQRFLELFSLDFEAYGYSSSFYSDYILNRKKILE